MAAYLQGGKRLIMYYLSILKFTTIERIRQYLANSWLSPEAFEQRYFKNLEGSTVHNTVQDQKDESVTKEWYEELRKEQGSHIMKGIINNIIGNPLDWYSVQLKSPSWRKAFWSA